MSFNSTHTEISWEEDGKELNISSEEYVYDYQEYYDYILSRLPDSLTITYEYSVKYVTIIIWMLSFFGNIFIFCIMMRKENKYAAIATYLTSLAVSDLIVSFDSLIISLETHKLRVFAWSDLGCKIYMGYYCIIVSCSVTSSWTLVVMSINRMISVCIPYKVKSFCNVRNARIVACLVWTLSFVFGTSCSIYTYTKYYPNQTMCYFEENNLKDFADFYVFFILFVDMYIPIVILLISSLVFIVCLYRRMAVVSKSHTSRKKTATIIIIAANTIFLATNIPYSVYVLYCTLKKDTGSLEEYLYLATIEQILLVCKDCNCALNFYMYFLAGTTFRKQSKEVLIRCCLPFKTCVHRRFPSYKDQNSSVERTSNFQTVNKI